MAAGAGLARRRALSAGVFWPLACRGRAGAGWLLVRLRTGFRRARIAWSAAVAALGLLARRFSRACWPGPWRPRRRPANLATACPAILFAACYMRHRAAGGQWYEGGLYLWLALVAGLTLACLVVGCAGGVLRGGLGYATRTVDDALASLMADLTRLSPRRTWALSRLAVKEAIRRSIVVVFVVFLVLLLFAGWFIDPSNPDPARLYMDLVLTSTGYLTLFLAMFLSALSLPEDIKNRTIHTVVTKPVRASEIVLGRIVGFTLVGTVLLGMMGVLSYVFVVRGVSHTHELRAADLHAGGPDGCRRGRALKGFTSMARNHQHEVTIDAEGHVRVETAQGHWHEVTVEGPGKDARYTVGPPQGMLLARVPIYGKLRFQEQRGRDREGGQRGRRMGVSQLHRRGAARAAAIWTFEGIDGGGISRGPAGGNDHRGLPHLQGRHRARHPRQPAGPQAGQRREACRGAHLRRQEIRHRRAVHPRELSDKAASRIDLFRDFVRRREAGGVAAMRAAGAVLRHGAGRSLPPPPA